MQKKIAEQLYRKATNLRIVQAALIDNEQNNLAEVVFEVADSLSVLAAEILGRDRYVSDFDKEADTDDV